MRKQFTPSPSGETLGLQEAADFLRLGYESMKSLIDSGAVPALVLNQKHVVLLREELIAYVRDEGRRQAEERRTHGQVVPRIEPKLRGSRRARAIAEVFEAAEEQRAASLRKPSAKAHPESDRLMRFDEIVATVRVSRATLYGMIAQGRFPKPVKIGRRSVWPEGEVFAYIEGQKDRRSPPDCYKNGM